MASTDTQLQLACKKNLINKDIKSKPLCKDKKIIVFHLTLLRHFENFKIWSS